MKYPRYLLNYLLSFAYDIYYFFFGNIRARIFGFDYYKQSKLYPDYLKQGNMAEAVKHLAFGYCQGKGLDIGGGNWCLPGARLIEEGGGEDAYYLKEADGSMDFIFSSHLLEHLAKWEKALNEWRRVLRTGGVLFLYLPHPVCVMWKPGVNAQHKWMPDPEAIRNFLTQNLRMEIREATYLPDGYLSFLIVAEKI